MTDATAAPPPDAEDIHALRPPRNQWWDVWDQFKTHKGAMAGMLVFVSIILFVTVGPWIWNVDPGLIDIRSRNLGSSWTHPMGTDQLGRDLLARMMYGGRVSVAVGLTAMLLGLILGTLIGVLAGYFRPLDAPLMRTTDLFLALPLLPLLLILVALFRDALEGVFGQAMGVFTLIVVAIAITSWMQTARIVRGDVLALKEREFVLAARSIGTPSRRINTRHVLPNVMSPIMVSATLGIASAIITESALSFLGLGDPNRMSWGFMIGASRTVLRQAWWMATFPGLAIMITVLALNILGEALNDALNIHSRNR